MIGFIRSLIKRAGEKVTPRQTPPAIINSGLFWFCWLNTYMTQQN